MSSPPLTARPSSTLPVSGILLAGLGAFAFSGKAIIVKLAYRYGVDATTLIALRMAFALPLFAAMGLYSWLSARNVPLSWTDRWRVVGLGFTGYYLASFLDFLGLRYITATLERLILYLNPTIVLAIGVLLQGRPVARRQLVALAISYVGIAIALSADMNVGGSNVALGSLLVFLSALSYAIYLVGSGEIVKRVGSIRLTAYASVIACLLCIAQFLVLRPVATLDLPREVYELSVLNAVACTVLPVLLVMAAISRVGAAVASQVGMIGPVATIILSSLVLGEHMGPSQIIGTLLVMGGVLVVSQVKK